MPLTLPRVPGFYTAVPIQPQVFPNELLLEILSQVTCEGSLHSLLRTSPTLRADVERRLYSGSYLNYDSWSERKHKRFLGLIYSTPRLAALVQVYSVRYVPTEDVYFSATLCNALYAMRNLEELTYQSIEPSLAWLLTRRYPFQLKKFALLSALEEPGCVATFLQSQPNLTHVVLHSEVTRRLYRMVQADLIRASGSNLSFSSSSSSATSYQSPVIMHICDQLQARYNVSEWKGKTISRDTFFHLPVDRTKIIYPTHPGVTKTLSKARQACVWKRPERRRRGSLQPILKSFVYRLDNVTNLELINRPEADVEEASFLSSLTTLAITCPNFPLRKMFQRTRYIQDLFHKFEFLEEVYMHCPSHADLQRPSEQWVYERWTKNGNKETRTRGEWGSIFVTQWDPEAMAISRHRPLTYLFPVTTEDVVQKR